MPTGGAMQVGRMVEIGTAMRIRVVMGTDSAVEVGRAVWISVAVGTGRAVWIGMAARLGTTMLIGAVVPFARGAPLCGMHSASHLRVRRLLREHFSRWGVARPRIFRPMGAL